MTVSAGPPPETPSRSGRSPLPARVSATGLRVRLGGRDILDGLDIAVYAGEIVAVSGPSGAGKTTLLLTLAGVLSPDAGVVEVSSRGGRLPSDDAGAAEAAVEQLPQGGREGQGAAVDRAAPGDAVPPSRGAGGPRTSSGRSEPGRSEPGPFVLPAPGEAPRFGELSPFDPLSSPDIPAPAASGRPARAGASRDRSESRRAARTARAGGRRRRDEARGGVGSGLVPHLPPAGRSADGGSPGGHGSREGTLGFIPQTFGLAPWLTSAENVALVMQVNRLPPDVVEQRTIDALDAVGLSTAVDRIVTELSGGQRQRVAVARALAAQPTVILADEPTAELDAENRSLVLELLLDAAGAGAAVVIATHDPEVTRSCTRRLVLSEGRLLDAP
jgi:putative ABC transport system ATP-binding protein